MVVVDAGVRGVTSSGVRSLKVRCPLCCVLLPALLAAARLARCCGHHARGTYLLDIGRLREVHVVDGVDDVLGRDVMTAEETTLEALDGVLAASDAVEFDVDLALGGTWSHADVDDLAIAVLTLALDVLFELLLPAWHFGTVMMVSAVQHALKGVRHTLPLCTGS